MKRSISILLCLVLIFSSFSFAFADEWSQSQITSVVNNVSSITTTLSNIYTRLGTIQGYLYDSGHSIAYWVSAIDSWMQPIYSSLTSNLAANLGLEPIISGLNDVINVSGGGTTYYPWLRRLYELDNVNGVPTPFTIYTPSSNGNLSGYTWVGGNNWRDSIVTSNILLNDSLVRFYSNQYAYLATGFNYTQNAVNWGNLGSSSFIPISATDGIYKWLSSIQAPVARLSYVLASDERIEAQEMAAANEQAVVDNFIDSNGDGSVPTSSFSDVSGLSSGVTSNLSTDASPAQIWDIFNSDHGSWFSQETANQLDTTTRTRGSEFETPLLDQQMEEIYKSLGGGK